MVAPGSELLVLGHLAWGLWAYREASHHHSKHVQE